MAALFVTSKGYPGLIVIAVALVATYSTQRRLPPSPFLAWAIRVMVFGTLLLTANPEKRVEAGSLLFDPGYTNLFGYCAAAELAIRAWVQKRGGPSKGEVMLLATIVFTAATNAGDLRSVWWVRTLAPVYLMLLVLTLRRFRARPARWAPGWVAALALAGTIGWTASWGVAEFESQITRWSMKFLSGRRNVSQTSIGLSRTATLGKVFNPQASAKRVMKIEGWPGERHMRAAAFDQYADGTWGPAVDQRDYGAVRTFESNLTGKSVAITRYGQAFGLVCVPLEAIGVAIDGEGIELQQDSSGTIRTGGDDVPDPFQYTLTVAREGVQGVVARPLSAEDRRWGLVVPKGVEPGVKELAERVAGDGDSREKVARIHTYLRSNHRYSLEVDPGDGDPVSAFLLKKMDAHCVYFASAVVIMARSVGVPARYASGYYAHESAGDGVTVVRDRDAHAWAECWIDGVGWVTVDATPAGGRPSQLFTETPAWRKWWERLQDGIAAIKAWLARRTLVEGAIMIAALAAVPVFIRVWKGRTARERKRVEEGYGPLAPELEEVRQRFERAMKKRGVTMSGHRTWRESVSDVEGAETFVSQYNALRFGGEGSVQQLEKMVEELEV